MIVASFGILLGATFSSGMMEIARKGVFNPSLFYFSDVMIIFLAVMLTDILLLDLFNTFGMPTSTTVSIVFELLGAAVTVSLIKMVRTEESLTAIGSYINSSSAFAIISGIFLSVGIAFTIGALVQFFSRWLFSFELKKRMNWAGPIWAALAMTAMSHFLFFKGIKGASFISESILEWVKAHTSLLLGISLAIWLLLFMLFYRLMGIKMLRIIVLFGTFSLAMAFAGNDLVNFIGVPIAGLDSYLHWKAAGTHPDLFRMDALAQPIRTKTYLLIIAGGIMILTLWFSKKARSVTETEVNLGRQDAGDERFASNALSRSLVRASLNMNRLMQRIMPERLKREIARNFDLQKVKPQPDAPAFDLIRASVNLSTASMLIALATTMRLPLSTTYVSFMVAMGTSLADQAWGRDSAVYRIAGVINVIGGWFLTAIIALSVSSVIAVALYFGSYWSLIVIIIAIGWSIRHTMVLHKKREVRKSRDLSTMDREISDVKDARQDLKDLLASETERILNIYGSTLKAITTEDVAHIAKAEAEMIQVQDTSSLLRSRMFQRMEQLDDQQERVSRAYILIYDLQQDLMISMSAMLQRSADHVRNMHQPLESDQKSLLQHLALKMETFGDSVKSGLIQSVYNANELVHSKKEVMNVLASLMKHQIQSIQEKRYGMKNEMLFMDIHLHTKDIAAILHRIQRRLKEL